MTLLNAWVLFGLIPIYFIYKKHATPSKQTKLLYLSLVFMFLAMARPAYENAYTEQNFDAHDYIIAIDASYSMQADDLKPSRYILAKQAIEKLIQAHPKDRFTLFAFTSSTLLISPPTTDTEISIMALEALNPKYILTKSTNLKNLFSTVSKLPMKHKNLIIFSDGGDEHDIKALATLAKRSSITPYIVATATERGAALKKDGKYIKNTQDSIVISKINPILIDLVNATKGKYYKLNALNDINKLSNDLQTQQTKKERIKVKTYKELFFLPLLIALGLFFLGVTKFAYRFFIFMPLLLLLSPVSSKAGVLDFYHLSQAKEAYEQKHYKDAAAAFKELTPSTKSYYNLANAYYKAGAYKKAIEYYTQIRTKDRAFKQKIFYNLGNAAVKLKKYDKAKEYYIYALALGYDKDALYNLTLLQKMHLKTQKDVSKMLPQNQKNSEKKTAQQSSKKDKKQNSRASKKSSNRSANKSSSGGGSQKKSKQKIKGIQASKKQKGTYKFTYKAYEKINKGYTNEKEPW